ncbi:MAG: flippase-like domain-containing protein [Thaumarchaeota archaeon]|nr:flippase-like domain-containing protein [Nitrososphaerota archaeon]
MKWVIFGLVLSSTVVILISVTSGVTISQLATIGFLPFVLAAGVSAAKLLVQILRFRVVVKGLAGDMKVNLKELAIVSMGSEFVALSIPSMSGGEFVRAARLSGKGVDGGKSLWMGYFEVLVDVCVCSALALAAAAYAFSRGAIVAAFTITVVVLPLITAYTLFLNPRPKGHQDPKNDFQPCNTSCGS